MRGLHSSCQQYSRQAKPVRFEVERPGRSSHDRSPPPRLPISVVIPTFDRAELVLRALASVYRQVWQPQEVLVIDDGSRDDTTARVATMFPEVRLLSQPHRGVSAARNRGVEAATSEWIALLDSDDEWLPHKLATQWQQLGDNREFRMAHSEEIWIRRGVRVNPMKKHAKSGGWIFRRCLPLCAISPSSALIHRSVFDRVGLFDESLPACEDYDLWLRVTARYPVLFSEEPLIVKHGGHDDQLSRQHWGMDRFRIQSLEKILAGGTLAPEDRRAAAAMLAAKSKIVASGAQKRGKFEEAQHYLALQERYAVRA